MKKKKQKQKQKEDNFKCDRNYTCKSNANIMTKIHAFILFYLKGKKWKKKKNYFFVTKKHNIVGLASIF